LRSGQAAFFDRSADELLRSFTSVAMAQLDDKNDSPG